IHPLDVPGELAARAPIGFAAEEISPEVVAEVAAGLAYGASALATGLPLLLQPTEAGLPASVESQLVEQLIGVSGRFPVTLPDVAGLPPSAFE
ncbi:MAG TPA: hypothetical protein VF772_26190, partial [Terriglobales bacterium]